MKTSTSNWKRPGWPWEVELFTFLLFLVALLGTLLMGDTGATAPAPQPAGDAMAAGRESLVTQLGFLTSIVIAGLYCLHLAIAYSEVGHITPPAVHFFSPLVFAGFGFYRLSGKEVFDGSAMQLAGIMAVIVIINTLLMHSARRRYLRCYRDTTWELVAPAAKDSGFFRLLLQLRPLLYPPRSYRVCADGLMLEGWHYANPIAFSDVQAISRVRGTGILNKGAYFAASLQNLIRLDLRDTMNAVFIAPVDPENFIKVCAPHIARRKPTGKASATRHDMIHGPGQTQGGDDKAPTSGAAASP
jgi:hypothetical protein